MSLEYFSEKTFPKIEGNHNKPKISMGALGGIHISLKACKMIGIDAKSKVSIVRDNENKSDWYITLDPDGFAVSASKKNQGFRIYHKALCEKFKNCFNLDHSKTCTFLISTTFENFGTKKKYWPILVNGHASQNNQT